MRAIVVPLYGALDLIPGGHREAICEDPVGEESLSKLKAYGKAAKIDAEAWMGSNCNTSSISRY